MVFTPWLEVRAKSHVIKSCPQGNSRPSRVRPCRFSLSHQIFAHDIIYSFAILQGLTHRLPLGVVERQVVGPVGDRLALPCLFGPGDSTGRPVGHGAACTAAGTGDHAAHGLLIGGLRLGVEVGFTYARAAAHRLGLPARNCGPEPMVSFCRSPSSHSRVLRISGRSA